MLLSMTWFMKGAIHTPQDACQWHTCYCIYWESICDIVWAADFLYGHICRMSSDWDFYCTGSPTDFSLFSHRLMLMGVSWEAPNINTHRCKCTQYSEGLYILNRTINKNKIQVMWQTGISAFDHVTAYSSIVQCSISGYWAGSMYHNLSINEFAGWDLCKSRSPHKKGTPPICITIHIS